MRTAKERLATLERAKRGDLVAREEITFYVWEKYGKRAVRKFFSGDLSEDRDDLQQVFHLGVAEAFAKVDHRGDPIYHLGMRGWWKVGAHVREARAFYRERSMDVPLYEGEGETAKDRLPDLIDLEAVVISQVGTEQQVVLCQDAELGPTARRAMEAILNDEAGDPTEIGFNKRLASALGVSQQRGTQAMQALRRGVFAEGLEN